MTKEEQRYENLRKNGLFPYDRIHHIGNSDFFSTNGDKYRVSKRSFGNTQYGQS